MNKYTTKQRGTERYQIACNTVGQKLTVALQAAFEKELSQAERETS